jgi:aspartate racemase
LKRYKTIGILGGVSPESTITYYEHIIRTYCERFGDHSYPEILIYSVSFQTIMDWQREKMWDRIEKLLINGIIRLNRGGADFGLIASNTMHFVFEKVQKRSPIPLISIIDVTAEKIKKEGIDTVGLLGTAFTMSQHFYKEKLLHSGINVLVPKEKEQKYINRVIHKELINGKVIPRSKEGFLEIIKGLVDRRAQGVILGCTEIPLLVRDEDSPVKLFDTTKIHADKALSYAISENNKNARE